MHYLSIGAMFRMENSWLDEWIQYHRALGVEHFYLFNHDEDSRVSDRILKPYIEQGLVDNIHVRDLLSVRETAQRGQMNAIYHEIIKAAQHHTQWLALIDLDEFIFPRQKDDLRELLVDYEEHAGLAVNWQMFGTSGYVKRPPTQINHLLYRAETKWKSNHYFKSIIKPDLVVLESIYDVHHFPCRTGETVNESHKPVTGLRCDISVNTIQLNHYVLRSWQDFWEVKAVRPRYNGAGPCNEEYFESHDRNEVFDDEISRRFGHVIEIG